jgi:hypothetical protein
MVRLFKFNKIENLNVFEIVLFNFLSLNFTVDTIYRDDFQIYIIYQILAVI